MGAGEADRVNYFGYLLDPANWQGIGRLLLDHLLYSGLALVLAAGIAIPLGVLIGHTGRGTFAVIGSSNAARAIPSLGLLVLIVIWLGNEPQWIVIVLAVLGLPPILTATAAGVAGADREAVHAARALGMTGGQIVAKVEWPLALPLVVSGLRSATLQIVATATIAGFVAGGALGQLLISGQRSNDYSQMFAGAFLVATLAIILDILLGALGWLAARRARPRARSARETLAAPV